MGLKPLALWLASTPPATGASSAPETPAKPRTTAGPLPASRKVGSAVGNATGVTNLVNRVSHPTLGQWAILTLEV